MMMNSPLTLSLSPLAGRGDGYAMVSKEHSLSRKAGVPRGFSYAQGWGEGWLR
jgi:hypothetical protein